LAKNKNNFIYRDRSETCLYSFNPDARSPQAADISVPRDFLIEAEIPETTKLCLKKCILSAEEEHFLSFLSG
jgi:hypothetical protein